MPRGDFALWRMTLPERERNNVLDALLRDDIKIDDMVDRKWPCLPQITYQKPPIIWQYNLYISFNQNYGTFSAINPLSFV